MWLVPVLFQKNVGKKCLSFPIHKPSVLSLFITSPEKEQKISISFNANGISDLELKNNVVSLYTDIQTCVINNGWISEMFRNTRGNRQGCPLSASLKPKRFKVNNIKSHSNESKAFLKSIKTREPSIL
jgi:hypothetical protein